MLKIRAASSLHEVLGDTPPDLRQRLKDATGQHHRRINRYIALAQLGALRCREAAGTIAADAALYLACDSSMLADTVKLLKAIEIDRRPPSPFEFMNVGGNMAGWTVGQQFGLNGPQLALHRNGAGLEAALELLMIPLPQHRRALLGYVEEGVWPLPEQRERLGLREGAAVAECSHWLYIDQDCDEPRAVIERCERYLSAEEAVAGLRGLPADTLLSASASIDIRRWSATLGLAARSESGVESAFSTGDTALALCRYVSGDAAQRLLHLNRSEGGEIHAVMVAPGRVFASNTAIV